MLHEVVVLCFVDREMLAISQGRSLLARHPQTSDRRVEAAAAVVVDAEQRGIPQPGRVEAAVLTNERARWMAVPSSQPIRPEDIVSSRRLGQANVFDTRERAVRISSHLNTQMISASSPSGRSSSGGMAAVALAGTARHSAVSTDVLHTTMSALFAAFFADFAKSSAFADAVTGVLSRARAAAAPLPAHGLDNERQEGRADEQHGNPHEAPVEPRDRPSVPPS